MNISREKLKNYIDAHFHDQLLEDNYQIFSVNPVSLLTTYRLDIAFKLIYLQLKPYSPEFAIQMYAKHLRALSLGSFTEPGNPSKNSLSSYIAEFDKISNNIKTIGFQSEKSLIPLSRNSNIVNGSHRIAASIYYNKKVDTVRINTDCHCYDYKFFLRRNVDLRSLELAVNKFIEYSPSIYVALIWPSANGHEDQISHLLQDILYKKNVDLTINGAKTLISQIYKQESWVGNFKNKYKGSFSKVSECFRSKNPLKVFAFQSHSHTEVVYRKEQIRKIFNIGKHSIHITDTHQEAIELSRLLFNDNSIHFLNYGSPTTFSPDFSTIKLSSNDIHKLVFSTDSYVCKRPDISLHAYGFANIHSSDLNYKNSISTMRHHFDIQFNSRPDKSGFSYLPDNYFYFQGTYYISYKLLKKYFDNFLSSKKNYSLHKFLNLYSADSKSFLLVNLSQFAYYLLIYSYARFLKLIKFLRLYKSMVGLKQCMIKIYSFFAK